MSAAGPRWLRALLAVDRAVVRAHELEATVRDEVVWAWVPRERRQHVTTEIYARLRRHAPAFARDARDARNEGRLHVWEERLLARPEVPRGGRVLLGGAGEGRELRALCDRGYAVTAFEPIEAFARAAEAIAAGRAGRKDGEAEQSSARSAPDARVLCGRYQDLAPALRREGSLASVCGEAYSFVWLGWRSLSHVVEERERLELFAALRRLAPDAPVLASFLPRRGPPPGGRARALLRRTFAALGAPATAPVGAAFIPHAGFAVSLAREDIDALADAGGYALAVCETELEGIALMVPDSLRPRRQGEPTHGR